MFFISAPCSLIELKIITPVSTLLQYGRQYTGFSNACHLSVTKNASQPGNTQKDYQYYDICVFLTNFLSFLMAIDTVFYENSQKNDSKAKLPFSQAAK